MPAATNVRFDTTNRGGTDKRYTAGSIFKITCRIDGEEVTLLHNATTVSPMDKLKELGVALVDAHIEKLR